MTVVSQLEVLIGGDVGDLQGSLRGADQQIDGFVGRVSKKMKSVGQSLTVGVTLPLVGIGTAAAKMAIDWESQFAGVRKTVSGTEEELAGLEQGLRDRATASDSPVAGLANSHAELAGIAEIAGQLGVETDDILGFTETIAQLGMATNLSGEEAALALAQFANITGMDMGDIDRLGSTIVDLGNNMATTEADIVAFATRLAGAGKQAGMSETDIVALAGAMASVGLNPEAAGTAMTQVVSAMTEAASGMDQGKLDLFASIAGMPIEDFQQLWEEDAVYAISDFVAGLDQLEPAAQIAALDELGLSGIRVTDMLRRLGGNTDLLTDALGRADNAWEDNTALTDEAQQRFATTSAQLNLLFNNLREVGIAVGAVFLPVINDVLDKVVPLLQNISNLNPDVLLMGVAFFGAAAAAGPLVAALGLLLSPIGLIAGGLAVAAIGVPLFVDALRDASPVIDDLLSNIEAGVGTMRDKINEALFGGGGGGGTMASPGATDHQFALLTAQIETSFQNAMSALDFSTALQPARDALNTALGNLFGGGGGGAATMASPGGSGGGIADSLAASISDSFSGVAIDTTSINTWATDNLNTILETVATVAGMVLGGPIGMTIGAGKLIASAIENDFLGIGTFLTESGISAAVEQGLKDVKIDIESEISNIFGGEGGGVDVSAMTDIGSSIKEGWDTYVQPIVDAVSDVVTQDIGPGLTDLGSGLGEFITNLGAADFSGLSTGLGSLSSLASIIIRIGGALAGGLLSGIGDSLPEIGTGIASFISAVSAAGNGDWGSALTLAGDGLKSIGSGLLQIPAGIADTAIGEIEKLTGVELPSVDEGIGAWVGAFETAAQTISIVMDNIKRGIDKVLLDIGISLTQAALDMANNPLIQLTPQAGMINQMVAPAEAGLAAAKGRQINIGIADSLEEDLVAANQGADIDLAGILFPEDTSGVAAEMSERGKIVIGEMMTKLQEEQDWENLGLMIPMAEALDIDTTGLTEMINLKLDEAILLGDEEAFNALIPTAVELDIPLDMLQIQMDESILDAAAAQDYEAEAKVLLSIDVEISNQGAINSAVNSAMKTAGASVTGGGSAQVHHTGGTFYHPSGEGLAFLKSGETIRTEAQEQALRRNRGGGARGGGDTFVVNSYGQSAYGLVTEVERAQRDLG